MPIYEYACGRCEHEFEVEQRITEEPVKTCPKCRSRRVKKLISLSSFVLKGGGWYSDLYSSNQGDDKGKDKDKDKDKGDGAKSDAKSDQGDKKADSKSDKPDKKGKGKGKKGSPKAA